MNLLAKFRETLVSVVPVMAIVLLLGVFVVPLDRLLLVRFVLGGALLIVGLTIFLIGVDLGIQPMGERCGSALTSRKNLALLLGTAFAIGFIVTAAEPDIQVFGDQVKGVFGMVSKLAFTFAIAAGVGLFIMLGLLRTVLGLSIKWTLFLSYTALLAAALFAPPSFIGIAFDSGGATTGPMTVPFIMALGLGVSSVRADSDNSFGITGIASIGPVLAVLLYALTLDLSSGVAAGAAAETATEAAETASALSLVIATFKTALPHVFRETLISIGPLFALFIVFQFWMLHVPRVQFMRLTFGFVWALLGLTVFLLGVNGGFMQAGAALGETLGRQSSHGPLWFALLIGTGLALGAIIVCAEPAVWVLSEQVEQVTNGMIRRKALLVFFSVGTGLAIGLAMWRAVAGFPLAWLLLPGYALAMGLMAVAPPMFTGIAFDSGGVASGPLTSTFVLSFTIGAASCGGSGNDSFGVIALVAMMPLIAIQLMGILYERQRRRNERLHAALKAKTEEVHP